MQEVKLQLAEAASQVVVLRLAATLAAWALKEEEEACDLSVTCVALPGARLQPLPAGMLARAATRSMRLLPERWSCWPLPGSPQQPPPVIVASVRFICCILLGSPCFVAFPAAIWFVLWLAVALTALLVVAQAVALQ